MSKSHMNNNGQSKHLQFREFVDTAVLHGFCYIKKKIQST